MQPHQQLEQQLSVWSGTGLHTDVAVVNSGTSALQLALQVLDLPKGSQVIVPTFTFVACARAVVMAGLRPLFIDCNERGLLDTNLLWQLSRERANLPAAIMPVHVYGRRCDVHEIHRWVFRRDNDGAGIRVVEDMAEAHGLAPHTASDAACWSFYRNKIVGGEEGGAVAFNPRQERYNDIDLAGRVRVLRNQGHWGMDDTWDHAPGGGNWRLADSLAEKISNSLSAFTRSFEQRRQMETQYDRLCPEQLKGMGWRQSPWVYDIRIPGMTSEKQDWLMISLHNAGIQARRGFRPLHTLTEFRKDMPVLRMTAGKTVAERLFREVVCLPLAPLDLELPRRAIDIVRRVLETPPTPAAPAPTLAQGRLSGPGS